MRLDDGVVSPGGVGFDINCGVRLIRTDLTEEDVRPVLRQLVDQLFRDVPSGVGAHGPLRVSRRRARRGAWRSGAAWVVERGYGVAGRPRRAPSAAAASRAPTPTPVSQRARQRGREQLGTLGAGNHFLEVRGGGGGLRRGGRRAPSGSTRPGQVMVIIHSGSRGFGHQVCQDYLDGDGEGGRAQYDIDLPDRQLACAPVDSPRGAGRTWPRWPPPPTSPGPTGRPSPTGARQAFAPRPRPERRGAGHARRSTTSPTTSRRSRSTRSTARRCGVCVHRKGATRAFPPGHPEVPPTLPRGRAAGARARRHGPLLVPAASARSGR